MKAAAVVAIAEDGEAAVATAMEVETVISGRARHP